MQCDRVEFDFVCWQKDAWQNSLHMGKRAAIRLGEIVINGQIWRFNQPMLSKHALEQLIH